MSPSLLPVALCLISAVTVAATNLFVKRGGDVLSTRMLVSLVMAASVLPLLPFTPWPSAVLWQTLGLSVMVHWCYQFAMVRALHRGDLSLVFPVMRGLAPLLTAVLATIFLQETPSLTGWVGLITATAALIVFALPEHSSEKAGRLRQAALFWACLTALGIGAYSVADANGMRTADTLITYIVWLFILDSIGISAAVFWIRRGRVWGSLGDQLRNGITGGLLGAVSYAAALWAFTLTEAATVTALRETSVVFGAIFGALVLGEPFGRRRILAAATLAISLILIQI
jgi:drug/metabolite transporter (DMT)-like permease